MKKVNSWKDISIKQYRELIDVVNEEYENDYERDIKILSIIYNVDEDTIADNTVEDIIKLKSDLGFLNELPKTETHKYSTIKIKDNDYDVCTDMNKFTYAQFVDFQTYWKEDSNLSKVLSVILVPSGGKYNSGYDIVEFIKEIEENVDIVTANSVCFFFLRSLQSLMKTTLKSLEKEAKMMKRMETSKEKKKEIQNQITKINQMQSILG